MYTYSFCFWICFCRKKIGFKAAPKMLVRLNSGDKWINFRMKRRLSKQGSNRVVSPSLVFWSSGRERKNFYFQGHQTQKLERKFCERILFCFESLFKWRHPLLFWSLSLNTEHVISASFGPKTTFKGPFNSCLTFVELDINEKDKVDQKYLFFNLNEFKQREWLLHKSTTLTATTLTSTTTTTTTA